MRSSVTSVFSEASDFRDTMRAEGIRDLVITGCGNFRARVTEIRLPHARMVAIEETVPRVASIEARPGQVIVLFTLSKQAPQTWDGSKVLPEEFLLLAPGKKIRTSIEGPCRWVCIVLSSANLAQHARALTGEKFTLPLTPYRWRPTRSAMGDLRQLCLLALSAARARSTDVAGPQAAHGLEQQLVHALVGCLLANDHQ